MPYSRIVSLVPSLTELLFDLGLGDRISGRTRFCIRPKNSIETVPVIGGTKNPRIGKIQSIGPDLIIANREENRKEDIDRLAKDYEVLLTDIKTVDDALNTIREIGLKLGVEQPAISLVNDIRSELDQIPEMPAIPTIYFIWRNPWMSVGSDTYIHDVMTRWNLENIFGYMKRYPEINLKNMADPDPALILLSSEPFPFRHKHIDEIRTYFPESDIRLVNGQWFSWYGSRMKISFRALNKWRKELPDQQVL